MGIIEAILVAVGLCADCFAVSLCSSVKLCKINWTSVLKVAALFAVIQTGLMLIGWAFGEALSGFVTKIGSIVGFLLLLYVGGSMLIEGIKGCEDGRDLNGLRNIIIGGIATSIDALAVGIAEAMKGSHWGDVCMLLTAVFVVTAISVIAGIFGGKTLGARIGRFAEIGGGLVLIGIGVSFLF